MNDKNEPTYEYLADNPNFKVMPIMLSLIIGAFFAILNETLLNIALTTLMGEFNVSLPTVQWMATGFMLIMGIVIPASAVLLQWFTTRQLFLGTMTIFTLGTTICALAPTFPILLIGRLIQAAGTGLLMPVIFNVFLLVFPPHRRGKVMGLVGLVIMFAPAIGPTLSGVIVEYLGWRFLFICVIPFALFSVGFAYKYLLNVSEVTKPKVDVLSLVYSTIGFGSLVYGFSAAGEGENGFLSPNVYTFIFIGVVGITLFAIRQFKLEDPVMDLRVFKYPMFTHGILMFLIIMMTMFSSEIILPVFMQGPLGLMPAAAGLLLLPGSILNGIMSPVMGHLFDKFGPRLLMIPASIVLSGTMFMMSRLNENTEPWMIIIGYIILMLTVSAIMMPAETNGLNQLPKRLYPHGTSVMTTLQPVAGAIGVSVFISILNARQAHYLSQSENPQDPNAISDAMVAGVELVYFIAFAISIAAVILAFLVYRAVPKDQEKKEQPNNI
ncbi:MDR family MFS transporter [Virgibacillus salexigens]|uniref:Multidrug resistance protein B n=1 Tax=Virgibacillus massiliensis TaxID=1462526 RepID=A0A024QF04_9BACI|nr:MULTISPECIES: MDR family MFS transporter [Virgibacillus]MYL43361.1 DHA2 family efflux MFS transporter permease subunit [Virgibacillus massiliensis]CDQ41123.1 Multidrug resistance protein B [Virgibacillus massiliensis]